jgi:hypothetical protein
LFLGSVRLSPFQDERKKVLASYYCHKEIIVGTNEDSVRARKKSARSTAPTRTTTRIHTISNTAIEKMTAEKKYEDFHGSTRIDMISLVSLPPYELVWNQPLKEKIALYAHADGSRRHIQADVRCCKSKP